MNRKSILLKGTRTTVTEADRRILDSYLTNHEIHEFPKDEIAYSLTDEDGFDIGIELFGQQYQGNFSILDRDVAFFSSTSLY